MFYLRCINEKKILNLNYIFSFIIIICNVFIFIPITYNLFKDSFGPMGYGLLILPLLLSIHLFLIPVIVFLFSIRKSNKNYFIANLIGILYYIYIFYEFSNMIFYEH